MIMDWWNGKKRKSYYEESISNSVDWFLRCWLWRHSQQVSNTKGRLDNRAEDAFCTKAKSCWFLFLLLRERGRESITVSVATKITVTEKKRKMLWKLRNINCMKLRYCVMHCSVVQPTCSSTSQPAPECTYSIRRMNIRELVQYSKGTKNVKNTRGIDKTSANAIIRCCITRASRAQGTLHHELKNWTASPQSCTEMSKKRAARLQANSCCSCCYL